MEVMRELLSHVADELNTKVVRYEADGGWYTLHFDTVKREATSISFERSK